MMFFSLCSLLDGCSVGLMLEGATEEATRKLDMVCVCVCVWVGGWVWVYVCVGGEVIVPHMVT